MRKKNVLALFLALAMSFTLCACGGSDEEAASTTDNTTKETVVEETGEENTATELVIGTENSVEGYMDFTAIKAHTTSALRATMGKDVVHENEAAGETFVDIVIDMENTSANDIMTQRMMTITAKNAAGAEYSETTCAMEIDGGQYVHPMNTIAAGSTARVHCAVSVPETETDLEITLDINGSLFVYNYVLGETETTAESMNLGAAIGDSSFGQVVFNDVYYTDEILPADTTGAYMYYAVEDTSNTYLALSMDLTNNQAADVVAGSLLTVVAKAGDNTEYTGFAVIEEEDGTMFDASGNIPSMTTRSGYYLIEVPKTVMENAVELSIGFNGVEYTYVL